MKKLFLLTLFAIMLIPSLCLAYVDSGEQNYTNLKLKYPIVYLNDQDVQNKINTDIATYVYKLKGRYDAGNFYQGSMKYSLKFEDENYISLTITSYWYNAGAAHGMYETVGLVYDKHTGNKIPISYFVPIQSAEQLENIGIRGHVTKLYNQGMKQIPLRNGWDVDRVSEDYYLGGNGTIYLIYQPYELASFADGNTYIEFTPQAIEYFRRMQH